MRHLQLSRRERQIMDILYRRGRATAAEVREDLPQRPSYSAVRAMLRTLEEKGHIRHEAEALRYVYRATLPAVKARRSALLHVVNTFFEGSAEQVVAALLDMSASRMSPEELEHLSQIVETAKQEGKTQ